MKLQTVRTASPPPDEEDMRLAQDSVSAFEKARVHSLKVLIDGRTVEIPRALAGVIGASLKMIADGQSIAVVPAEKEIGTQEAANLLGVSRPYLVKLLDQGEIPSRKVGVQRRVLVKDVADYREREKAARRAALNELAALDRELGLGE